MQSFIILTWLCIIITNITLANSDILEDILSGKAPTTLATSNIKNQTPYNRNRRPRKGGENSKDPVEIKLYFILKEIVSLDEKNQLFTTSISLILEWTDPRLSWNSSMYDGLEYTVPNAKQFWLPDLALMNTVSGSSNYLSFHESQIVIIDSYGTSYLNFGLPSLTTRCRLNVWKYPFDRQECSIIIGSWQRNSQDLLFVNASVNQGKVFNGGGAFIKHPFWIVKQFTLATRTNKARFTAYLENVCFSVF